METNSLLPFPTQVNNDHEHRLVFIFVQTFLFTHCFDHGSTTVFILKNNLSVNVYISHVTWQ